MAKHTPNYAALVRTDPTPAQTVVLRWIPEQYLRQLGVGGWVEEPHARAKASTRWEGTPLHRVMLDIHLDALRASPLNRPRPDPDGDIEEELALLHSSGLPVDPTDPLSEPPKIQIKWSYGQQLRWVIQDIAYRNFTIGLGSVRRRRVQADLTLELLEYRAAKLALSPVEAAAAAPAAPDTTDTAPPAAAGTRTYTVKSGDTLTSIAARELGSASRWPEIYALNSPPASNTLLAGPDLLLVGQVLVLPTS